MITKASVAGRRKRAIRAGILSACAAMGKGDGETFANCITCDQPARLDVPRNSPDMLEIGHVIPEAFGGEYIPSNLIPMCYACNRALHYTDATLFVWAFDPRDEYPSRFPNVAAGTVPVSRPMGSLDGRGAVALVRR